MIWILFVVSKSFHYEHELDIICFANRNNLVFPVSDKNVALIIKKHSLKAGLDDKKYAGHSLRSGFATTTAELGASERNIMAMTGHKSVDMVRKIGRAHV